jgi:glutaredoxin
MLVILYSMDTCPFCIKAKEMFHKELASGKMKEKSAKEAPQDARGFPLFVCAQTGKTFTGLPPNKETLWKELGHTSENFSLGGGSHHWIWIVLLVVVLGVVAYFGYTELKKRKQAGGVANKFAYTHLNRQNNFM